MQALATAIKKGKILQNTSTIYGGNNGTMSSTNFETLLN
jgi:hypothetical protein